LARKILLADDSVTAQNMGRRILTDAGYEVITVNNGAAAMKKINEIKPDLIVLDIYMPGYGGLEICQRIRETPELARIPVLLTVGKLEPFKADDAKRVRADAFVIKPFEASELLTALTKLEDKIVPSGQSFAGGRFSRAVASLEEIKSGKEFGDTDTGWKSRLKIPAPYSKPHESHAENHASATDAEQVSKNPDRKAEEKPEEKQTGNVASILPEAIASALPHNVTPEEIEAIAAAAALLAGHADSSAGGPIGSYRQADVREEASGRGPAAEESGSLASGPQSNSENISQHSSIIEESSSSSMAAPWPELRGVDAEPATQSPKQDARADEVDAMLASLSPSQVKAEIEEVEELVPVTIAAAVGAGDYSGPRWIAEATTVSEEESTIVLQLEMERAFAAFAAADAARAYHVDHMRDSGARSFVEKALEIREKAEVESPIDVAADISASSQDSAPPADDAAERQIDQSAVTETVEVAAVELNQQDAEKTDAPQEEKAAYAVASAGAGTSGVPSSDYPASDSLSSDYTASDYAGQDAASEVPAPVAASASGSEVHDNNLAAAWASWKQVRESAVTPQAEEQAESSQVEFREPHQVEAARMDDAELTESEASAAAAEEASEVASIVDSVLADLKPKLMKEIAQKMGKGKKKKKGD